MSQVAKIKTRETVKDIKVFDRVANASAHMKNTFIRSKDSAEQTQEPVHDNPESYASEKVSASVKKATKDVSYVAADKLKNPYKKVAKNVEKTKDNLQKTKEHVQEIKDTVKGKKSRIANQTKQKMGKQTKNTVKRATSQTREASNKSIKTMKKSERTIKQSTKAVKATSKNMAKATGKSIKTAEHTARTTIKTTQETAKITHKAVQASAKAAKVAVQVSKKAAQATIQATKTAIKVTILTVKAIIAATKALISAIAAGGWIAVLIIFIIVLFGGVLALFGGNSGNANSHTPVSAEVVAYEPLIRHYAREHGIPDYVELIKAVMMQESGGRGNDPMQASECGYNTRYPRTPNGITDPEYSVNVGIQNLAACLNLAKVENPLDIENIKLSLQGYNFGNGYISWAIREHGGYSITNASEFSDMMAERYGWSRYGDKQYVPHVLRYYPFRHGFSGGGNSDIVNVALTQLGNVGGAPYWSWYGFSSRVEWCATFVSWCADQAGYIESGVIPKFSLCQAGANWFKAQGQWQDRSYTPNTGDIIFFDWNGDGHSEHVGIVEKVENGVVYTVEGNSSDMCRQRSYTLGSNLIYGYGIPAY